MKAATVALVAVGAAGAGLGVYFLVIKPRQVAAAAAAGGPTSSASPAVSTKQPVSVGGVNVSTLLSGDHVARKNALAPAIVGKLTGGIIPSGVTSTVTNIAGKLSLSSYAERYITTKVPIVGAVAEAPINVAKKAASVATNVVSSVGSALSSLF